MNAIPRTNATDIILMINNNNVRATLKFIGQDSWPITQDVLPDSGKLTEAGEDFMKMVLVESDAYPLHVWLVVPEHNLVRELNKIDMKVLSFKISKEDEGGITVLMKIKNKDAFDMYSVIIKPKNEYDF